MKTIFLSYYHKSGHGISEVLVQRDEGRNKDHEIQFNCENHRNTLQVNAINHKVPI